jgi:hypothetical protein
MERRQYLEICLCLIALTRLSRPQSRRYQAGSPRIFRRVGPGLCNRGCGRYLIQANRDHQGWEDAGCSTD